MNDHAIGIIGGTGLYAMPGISEISEFAVSTPFGSPSDVIVGGLWHGRRVFFLPRHGRGHRIAPHEINHRANIYALRSLGVRWVISVAAVGSLQEAYPPRTVVLPDQFYDRTSRREHHTFFGEGIVAHVSLAEPFSPSLRHILAEACHAGNHPAHNGGTYVNMDGPAFSTRAESAAYRQLGFDIIGMTNVPEAKLSREAEMSMATLALVTDYDCWKIEEHPVTADTIISHLHANVATAQDILDRAIPMIPLIPDAPEHHALDQALVTQPELWPEETRKNLLVILERFVR